MTPRRKAVFLIGLAGAIGCICLFINRPSFPTPDKLLVFGAFIGMLFGQAKQFLIRLAPFVLMLLAYESFRGLVPGLNTRVNYMFMPDVDRFFFGSLPTKTLQDWWWNGQIQWYDFLFYVPYMLHFVLPFALAIYVWKKFESEYWRYVTAFVGISFFAFIVFLIFPAAPPWMASDYGLIEPITRVSSGVWFSLGIQDFPSLYNNVSPNPVAAVPSLHAAYATLFALFFVRFFKSKWRYLAWVYPILIWVGTVYQGEHHVFDEVVGALLGITGYYASPWITKQLGSIILHIRRSAGI